MLRPLLDLVLPAGCAGCGVGGVSTLCRDCDTALTEARPVVVRPRPVPPGLPRCHAIGGYHGLLRDLVLRYKERGRRPLAGPLGERLAVVAAAAVPGDRPMVLVPVPATARAVRRRRGDHMRALARVAAAHLRAAGRSAVVMPALRTRSRPDSAGLSAAERARVAEAALTVRPGLSASRWSVPATSAVVLVDDVITTGATISAACRALSSAGVVVDAAAVLAATERRRGDRV